LARLKTGFRVWRAKLVREKSLRGSVAAVRVAVLAEDEA